MKKFLTLISVVLFCSSAFAAGITGSKHDFTAKGWNASGSMCGVCHAPHNPNSTSNFAPLWNHAQTTATFTTYTSSTLNATADDPKNNVSKLCLSCHDGTVALDSFGGATGTNFVTGAANVGTNLSNDHPVGITYNAALATADGDLLNPASLPASLPLFSERLECATCHDVHNKAGNAALLRVSNAGSAMCMTCHTK